MLNVDIKHVKDIRNQEARSILSTQPCGFLIMKVSTHVTS